MSSTDSSANPVSQQNQDHSATAHHHDSFSQTVKLRVEQLVTEHTSTEGPLLPILHQIQAIWGYIPKAAIAPLAHQLLLSQAEIVGVISFYRHFRTSPPPCHIFQICRAEACQARGSRQFEKDVKSRLGIDFHQTTDNKVFGLEPVYCLGNCSSGPSMMLDDTLHSDMNKEKFEQLLDSLNSYSLSLK